MRVIVAGGGIGGLAAALALAQRGISDVVVVEAASEIRPLGVGITLLPHASRVIDRLGLLDQITGGAVAATTATYWTPSGKQVFSEPLGTAAGFASPQLLVHRGELQMALLDAVRSTLGPESVLTGHRITAFVPSGNGVEVGLVTDGGDTLSLHGDLLIGADGIHSVIRHRLVPNEGPPDWNGALLWRGLARIPEFLGGNSTAAIGNGDTSLLVYPIGPVDADGEVTVSWLLRNVVGGAMLRREDWNRRADPASLAPLVADWTLPWLDTARMIASTQAVFEYPMVDREPLLSWTGRRVTLLGDAAHPTYPVGSGGTTQALLDALVLADSLATAEDPQRGLEDYEGRRRQSTTKTQRANRTMGPEKLLAAAAAREASGQAELLPEAEALAMTAEYRLLCGHDLASMPS